jgi:PKD repeat protein
MKTHMKLIAGLSLLAIFFFTQSFNALSQTHEKYYQDGKIYFKFKDDVQVNIPVNPDRSVDFDKVPLISALRSHFEIKAISMPFDLNNDPKLLRIFMLEFSNYMDVEEIMDEMMQNCDLEYAEKVPLDYIDYHPDDSLYNLSVGSQNWNWHLDVVNAEQAWDLNLGSADVKVAIVDNAVWIDHPDLENKIILSKDVTTVSGNSNPPAGGDPADWSHGTHCAGLAGAETNNDLGVASLGHTISIIGVKATINTSPTAITHGYAGVQWAANNGADVISMSWGGPGFSQTNQNLMNTVWGMGIMLVASAGNENTTQAHYPSGYNHVVCIASTDEDDIKSDFSNYGNAVDFCAPGGYGNSGPQGLMSTTYEETSHGYYNTYFGTSMATPFAAGLCGLIKSVNPDLTPDEIEAVIESTCAVIDTIAGNASYAGMLGEGRIDAYQAVLNTPFAPTAQFHTPLQLITPGSAIQFFDQSTGVPNEWSWEFPGGSPYLSSQPNPTVTYATAGVYTVYLGVTNDFGTDVETKTNYITVTSTPHPWPLFVADKTYSCKAETVSFTDQSLYSPTSWLWEFNPATVTFVEGTSETSQNPKVTFDAPGTYSVSLTAANANGSGTKTTEDMITVEGIELNFDEDFESGSTASFVLEDNTRSRIGIDDRAAYPGSAYGLHFQGGGQVAGWAGGPTNTTPEQAWLVNTNFHASASNCNIDATGVEGVSLQLDLRQTYSIGNTYSWFRVLINDEQVEDVDGNVNFNPATNSDPWETRTFNLAAYGNTMFSLSLQSACYLLDGFYNQGDNVFVDNIVISNNTSVSHPEKGTATVLTFPNPVSDVLNFSASGIGMNAIVKIFNIQGQVVFYELLKNHKDGDVRRVNLETEQPGVYVLQVFGDKRLVTKKIIVN